MGLTPYPSHNYQSISVPPFPFKSTRKQTEVDLRENMKIMLEGNEYEPRRGHWVLLRRMDSKQRCTCWNQVGEGKYHNLVNDGKYNEPQLRCPICHGEGWIYQDEPHLVRRVLVAPEIGMAGATAITDIGFMTINYIVFYFQYYVKPQKNDNVIELELDDHANPLKPWRFKEIYRIAVSEPFRDEGGRVEYWRTAAKLLIT